MAQQLGTPPSVVEDMTLHPLIPTSHPKAGDTSMDTGVDHELHGFDEDMQTEPVFGFPGIDTQGPAGSAVPERPPPVVPFEKDDASFRYMDDLGEAPPDSAGPVDPLQMRMSDYSKGEGMEEASEAVIRALRAGKGGMELLEEMEAAEQAYNASHQAQAAAAAAQQREQQAAAASGSSSGHGICADTRQRVVEKLAASLQQNGAFMAGKGPGEALEAAQRLEQELFASSHSKTVYLSKASNAVRVAKTVADVADLPRIASGEPKPDPAADDTTPYVTGLQGYVLKPDYT